MGSQILGDLLQFINGVIQDKLKIFLMQGAIGEYVVIVKDAALIVFWPDL